MKKLLLAVTTLLSVAAWAQTPNLDYTRNSNNSSTSPGGNYLDYDDEEWAMDTVYKNIPIGFPFIFNGNYLMNVDISSNGYVMFGNNGSVGEIHMMAAPLMDRGSFDPASNSTISYRTILDQVTNKNKFQVFWTVAGFRGQSNDSDFVTITLELIENDHTINMYYGNSRVTPDFWSEVMSEPSGGIIYNVAGNYVYYCFTSTPFSLAPSMANGAGTPPTFTFSTGSGILHSFSSVYAGKKDLTASNLRAYPNPTVGNLKVEADGFSADAVVTLTDITGKEVFRTTLANAGSIVTDNFANGLYVLTVTDAGKTATEKVMVQ